MDVMMVSAFGVVELLVMLLLGGSSLTGLPLGMPPGEWDDALPRTPPEGCVVYFDWASRSAGTPGAPGMEGFVADPEVQAFVRQVEHGIRVGIDSNAAREEDLAAAAAGVDLATTLVHRPGCLFVSFPTDDLPQREEFPNFALVFQHLKVGLVIQTGDDGDAIHDALAKVFTAGDIELPAELDRFVLPVPVPGGGITLHRAGDYMTLCYGQGTLDAILAGLDGNQQGILGDERITAALEHVSIDHPGQRTWVDLPAIITAIDRVAGSQAMVTETVGPLGLDAIQHIASTVGIDPATGQIATRLHVATDGRDTGLMALFAGHPLTPQDFAHIPADADFYVGKSLDHQKIFEAVREIVFAANPDLGEEFDAGVVEFENEFGFSFKDDLFAGFGDVWTLYDSPSGGGVVLSAPVLALEVRDYDTAGTTFLKFIEILEANMEGHRSSGRRLWGVFLASHEFEVGETSHAIAFVNIVGDDDIPFAPSFCLTKTHLLFALHPQELKAHLRFLHAGDDDVDHLTFADDHPLNTRRLMYFNRIDTEAALRYLTAISPYVGQAIATNLQSERVEIDLFALPSARGVLPYLSESSMWIEVGEAGITCGGANGVPIPGIGGGMTLMPAMLFSVRAVGVATPAHVIH